ncbi:MAG: glycosyltransferase [Chloroflexi bacterium]|nr:glycosyltransferase [Chloroflexota bacterium]
MASQDIAVVQISAVRLNPYVNLLSEALNRVEGVRCVVRQRLGWAWLFTGGWQADVWHLHWLELLCGQPGGGPSHSKLHAIEQQIKIARRLGVRIVYTVHNLNGHEADDALVGEAHAFMFQIADALHVHDKEARKHLSERYGRQSGVVEIPHGNYVGVYPNDCSPLEARARLALPSDSFIYLFLGQIRPYKGIEELVAAFTALPGEKLRLIIAGNAHDPAYAGQIKMAAAVDARISVVLHYVPAEELQYYFNASDVCVLPYREVTTSGAAILAFSFGCPVVAPHRGAFPALLDGGRGILYDPNRADGLRDALMAAQALDRDTVRRQVFAYAESLSWDSIAEQFVTLYRSLAG